LVAQQEASRSEIRHLVSRFFRNSHEDLVLNILEDRGVAPQELERLRRMLELGETKPLEQSETITLDRSESR
jgi:predicted transcriptional regulator